MTKTLNKTLGRLIIAFLLLCTAMVPASCGSRKVQSNVAITENTAKSNVKTELEKESESVTKTQSESSETKGKVKESQETTTTTKEFDPNTGKQTKETTTTNKTGKSASNSEKKNKTNVERYTHELEKLRIVTITITKDYSKNKNKATDANNNALYYMLFALGGLIILACLAYKWFTTGK